MSEVRPSSAILAFAESRKFSRLTLDRWCRLDAKDQATLLQLAERLRLGENQFRDFLDWSEEIALRDGCSVSEVWAREPVSTALARDLGRNELIGAVKTALRRLRFPQLVAAEDRLSELVKTLGLPRAVRLRLPEHLEGTEVRVEITAESPRVLRDNLAVLQRACNQPELDEIFRLLQEFS
jgi:hypothetical protein